MKTLKLSVKIEGGMAFLQFHCFLYKDGVTVDKYSNKQSFEYDFKNLDGEYILDVYGTNPISKDKKTTINIIFDEQDIELDKNISSKTPSFHKGNRINTTYFFKTKP
jgi:hypothetical protein